MEVQSPDVKVIPMCHHISPIRTCTTSRQGCSVFATWRNMIPKKYGWSIFTPLLFVMNAFTIFLSPDSEFQQRVRLCNAPKKCRPCMCDDRCLAARVHAGAADWCVFPSSRRGELHRGLCVSSATMKYIFCVIRLSVVLCFGLAERKR